MVLTMKKIKLHYLLGDTHRGGHDVHRIARLVISLLNQTNTFDILVVCDGPGLGDVSWDDYFRDHMTSLADAFIFNCGNYRFNIKEEQVMLEEAVAGGAGFLLMHGDHPCYWQAAGMVPWEGFERMAGFLWRERTAHGDFGDFDIRIDEPKHPITQGLGGFKTRDEIFCTMENPHNVPYEVLASAYSDPETISRHNWPGTGMQEGVVITGRYGEGRTVNFGIGHVWPYYTGHGLGENTMISWMPKEVRTMLVRSCEWMATGEVRYTRDFMQE